MKKYFPKVLMICGLFYGLPLWASDALLEEMSQPDPLQTLVKLVDDLEKIVASSIVNPDAVDLNQEELSRLIQGAYAQKRLQQIGSPHTLHLNLNSVLDNPHDHHWYIPEGLGEDQGGAYEDNLDANLALLLSLVPDSLREAGNLLPPFYVKLCEARDFADVSGRHWLFCRMRSLLQKVTMLPHHASCRGMLDALMDEMREGGEKCADNAVLRLETAEHLLRMGHMMASCETGVYDDAGFLSLMMNAFKISVLEEIVEQRVAESNEEALYLRLRLNNGLNLRQSLRAMTHFEIAQKRPLPMIMNEFFARMDVEHFLHFVTFYRKGGAGVWDQYLLLQCPPYQALRAEVAADMAEDGIKAISAYERLKQDQETRLLQMLIFHGYVLDHSDYPLPEGWAM